MIGAVFTESADEGSSAGATRRAARHPTFASRAHILTGCVRQTSAAIGQSIAAADGRVLKYAGLGSHLVADARAATGFRPTEPTGEALGAAGAGRGGRRIDKRRRIQRGVARCAWGIDGKGGVWIGETHIGGVRIAACTGVGGILGSAADKTNCEESERAIEVIHPLIVHPRYDVL